MKPENSLLAEETKVEELHLPSHIYFQFRNYDIKTVKDLLYLNIRELGSGSLAEFKKWMIGREKENSLESRVSEASDLGVLAESRDEIS